MTPLLSKSKKEAALHQPKTTKYLTSPNLSVEETDELQEKKIRTPFWHLYQVKEEITEEPLNQLLKVEENEITPK